MSACVPTRWGVFFHDHYNLCRVLWCSSLGLVTSLSFLCLLHWEETGGVSLSLWNLSVIYVMDELIGRTMQKTTFWAHCLLRSMYTPATTKSSLIEFGTLAEVISSAEDREATRYRWPSKISRMVIFAYFLTHTAIWDCSTQLSFRVPQYVLVRFAFAVPFDFMYYAVHWVQHKSRFVYKHWHKTHHEDVHCTYRTGFTANVLDFLWSALISYELALYITMWAFGIRFTLLEYMVWRIFNGWEKFFVHCPFDFPLFSRFVDFYNDDSIFGFGEPAHNGHVAHHINQKANLGLYNLFDKLLGTYVSLRELSGSASVKKAIDLAVGGSAESSVEESHVSLHPVMAISWFPW